MPFLSLPCARLFPSASAPIRIERATFISMIVVFSDENEREECTRQSMCIRRKFFVNDRWTVIGLSSFKSSLYVFRFSWLIYRKERNSSSGQHTHISRGSICQSLNSNFTSDQAENECETGWECRWISCERQSEKRKAMKIDRLSFSPSRTRDRASFFSLPLSSPHPLLFSFAFASSPLSLSSFCMYIYIHMSNSLTFFIVRADERNRNQLTF